MKTKWTLATLIPGFFASNFSFSDDDLSAVSKASSGEQFDEAIITPLNVDTPLHLAAHRSHSSHRSHGSHSSHRSSAGGSYTRPSPSPSPIPQPQSEPRSQPSKPDYTFPESSSENSKLSDRVAVIRRIQLALDILGYYDGAIDGIMGPKTRMAIQLYRVEKHMSKHTLIDEELLNSLGILTQ